MLDTREPLIYSVAGQKLFAVTHTVKNPRAAVLFCHGFGGNKVGFNRLFVEMAEGLAEKNISSLRVDFRGAGDSEGTFESTTLERLLEDSEASFQQVLKLAPKIAVIGISLGGMLSSLLAERHELAALALWAPVFDGRQWRADWEKLPTPKPPYLPYRGRLVDSRFFEQFFQLNPSLALRGAQSQPTLFVRGGRDETVDDSHFAQYEQAAKESNYETSFLELPNSDHQFTDNKERKMLINATLEWFDRHI